MGDPRTILGGAPYHLLEMTKGSNKVMDEKGSKEAVPDLTPKDMELLYGLGSLKGRLKRSHLESVLKSSLRGVVSEYLFDLGIKIKADIGLIGADELDSLQDACFEALTQDAPCVKEYEVEQDFGPYGVYVMGVSGVYFISALERDPIGPFTTVEAAQEGVLINFDGMFTDDGVPD